MHGKKLSKITQDLKGRRDYTEVTKRLNEMRQNPHYYPNDIMEIINRGTVHRIEKKKIPSNFTPVLDDKEEEKDVKMPVSHDKVEQKIEIDEEIGEENHSHGTITGIEKTEPQEALPVSVDSSYEKRMTRAWWTEEETWELARAIESERTSTVQLLEAAPYHSFEQIYSRLNWLLRWAKKQSPFEQVAAIKKVLRE